MARPLRPSKGVGPFPFTVAADRMQAMLYSNPEITGREVAGVFGHGRWPKGIERRGLDVLFEAPILPAEGDAICVLLGLVADEETVEGNGAEISPFKRLLSKICASSV